MGCDDTCGFSASFGRLSSFRVYGFACIFVRAQLTIKRKIHIGPFKIPADAILSKKVTFGCEHIFVLVYQRNILSINGVCANSFFTTFGRTGYCIKKKLRY